MTTKTIQKWLKQLAKAAKVDEKVVVDLYEKSKEDFKHLEDEELEEALKYDVGTKLKAHKRSSAVLTEGLHLGSTAPFDYNFKHKNTQRKFLMSLLEEFGATAPTPEIIQRLIEKGYSDPSSPDKIIWLDIKAKFNSGKDNPNYGNPWKPAVDTSIMNLVGFGRPAEEIDDEKQEMKKFSITISDESLFEDKGGLNNVVLVEPFTMFLPFTGKMLHYPDKSDDTTNAFNLSSLTDFEYGEPVDVLSMCKKHIPDQVQTVTSLHEHYEKYGNSGDDFVVFEAGVQSMRLDPSPIGTRKLYVDDPYADPLSMFTDDGIVSDTLVEVPEHILIDFERGSRIIVVGKTKQKQKWIRGENGEKGHESPDETELLVEALGLYPIPNYSKKPQKTEPVTEPDVEGW